MLLKLSLNSTYGIPSMIAPSPTATVVPLDLLHADEEAHIVELLGNCQHIHRLEEMGLQAGTRVRMVRPGAPCLLAIDGKRISLRLDGLTEILVSVA